MKNVINNSPFARDVKIMKDPQTLVHKGYGFVSFVNKPDAESAIAQMNGQWLGTRKIRTNWATRKVQPGGMDGGMDQHQQQQPHRSHHGKYANKLDYNEVWARASDTNTTVYCGGINNISEELVRATFGLYGQIIGIHSFPDRGYAFIRFVGKEAACNAICGVHGMEINGGVAKCSWGKENIDISGNSTQSGLSSQMGGGGGGGGGYGNPQSAASLSALQQGVSSLQSMTSNPWTSAGTATAASQSASAWTAANYQWATTGYQQNPAAAAMAANYWQGYPAAAANAYQNAMAMQGWGVMPTAAAGAANGAAAQYAAQLGQYQQQQQSTNGNK